MLSGGGDGPRSGAGEAVMREAGKVGTGAHPRASNPNPYIGCKISLISQAEMRYVGVLYSVDEASSNIVLSDVRSMGTEDRPAPVPCPPRKETYQNIVFKAADIKDLRIHGPGPVTRPASPAADKLSDPAIVAIHSQAPPKPALGLQASRADRPASPAPAPLISRTPATPQAPAQSADGGGDGPKEAPKEAEKNKSSVEAALEEEETEEEVAGFDGGPVKLLYAKRLQDKRFEDKQRFSGGGLDRKIRYGEFYGPAHDPRLRPSAKPFQPLYRLPNLPQPPHGPFYRGLGELGGPSPHHSYRGHQGYGRPGLGGPGAWGPGASSLWADVGGGGDWASPWAGAETMDLDYDFEAANALFAQTMANLRRGVVGGPPPVLPFPLQRPLREVGTQGDIRKPNPLFRAAKDREAGDGPKDRKDPVVRPSAQDKAQNPEFYDSKASFFDRISCDAVDKSATRPHWKKRQNMNLETFGEDSVYFPAVPPQPAQPPLSPAPSLPHLQPFF